MSAPNNQQNKTVDLMGGPGLFITTSDMWDYVQYDITIDESTLKRWFEEQIIKGAVERAELEHKIAQLESRLEFLERKS